jgi:hypothetical protein
VIAAAKILLLILRWVLGQVTLAQLRAAEARGEAVGTLIVIREYEDEQNRRVAAADRADDGLSDPSPDPNDRAGTGTGEGVHRLDNST